MQGWGLDLMILVGPFQLWMFQDSVKAVILAMALKGEKTINFSPMAAGLGHCCADSYIVTGKCSEISNDQ